MANIRRKAAAIGSIAALCLIGCIGLFGCGGQAATPAAAPTVQELLDNPFAGEDPTYTEMTLYMNLEAHTDSSSYASENSEDAGDSSNESLQGMDEMTTKINVVAPIKASKSNNTSYIAMQMGMDILGMTMNLDSEEYSVVDKESKTVETYSRQSGMSLFGAVDDEGWTKETEELTQENANMFDAVLSLSDLIENPTLSEEDGAYIVTGTISSKNAVSGLVSDVSSSTYGSDEEENVLNISLTYDKGTKQLQKISFSYPEETLKQLQEENYTIIDAFDFHVSIDKFNNTDEVVVPEDVIASANGTASGTAEGAGNSIQSVNQTLDEV